ncbi:MAG TPA: hypothetical protein VKF81_01315 [Blastocatellia bacterium]|nr:hypothetical protein [Blastocatellia bacterium]
MSIYESNEIRLPDSEFESGEYRHLVIGNCGRLLDSRRTPIKIIDIRRSIGIFVVRIEAFEDKGALWEIPFEEVSNYQFEKGGQLATASALLDIHRAVDQFAHPLQISLDQEARTVTLKRIVEICAEVGDWLEDHSQFFSGQHDLPTPEARKGAPELFSDLQEYLASRELCQMEEALARQFVSNPYSGEMVKGHQIVMAELGLVAYEGKLIRDPELFSGKWNRARRAEHILCRMAFVQSVFRRLGHDRVCLYRGISFEGRVPSCRNRTFVSATFSIDVANSHFESADEESIGVLYRQFVPIERLFMTYYETEQMNIQFREAEAVLLYDEANPVF